MQFKKLGKSNLEISSIGLGYMGMSEFYGPTNEGDSIRTLHRALELGINFLDTADQYGSGANEALLKKALIGKRRQAVIATKFGIKRDPNDPKTRTICGTPEYVREACDASLSRLGIDCIDLYYLHRIDKGVPIEDTVGAMAELVRVGKVKYIGLSEANPETILKAHKVHPISALQTEYSLWSRGPEESLIPLCEKLGITFVAYSPLGRGFLTGQITSLDNLANDDFRRGMPRFKEENFAANYKLVEAINQLASEKRCISAQLALSWVMAFSDKIVPIPGTKRLKYLEENAAAVSVVLSTQEISLLNRLSEENKVQGSRYHELGMTLVDL